MESLLDLATGRYALDDPSGGVNPLLIIAAVVGDRVGHSIRRRIGPQIFAQVAPFQSPSRRADPRALMAARSQTMGIARFVAIIRTFGPVLAGVRQMEYRRLLFYNVFGGVGWWVVSMT